MGRHGRLRASARKLLRFVLLAGFGLLATWVAGMSPAVAGGDGTAGAVINVPERHAPPTPGAPLIVKVPPGALVRLDPAQIDIENSTLSLDGGDLVIEREDGARLVLEDFFASVHPPAALAIGDQTPLPADLILQQIALEQGQPNVDDLAADEIEPAAGAGDEIFGVVHVVSWLVDRLAPIADAEAAETSGAAAEDSGSPDPGNHFAQMRAQIVIAREAAIVALAGDYLQAARELAGETEKMLNGGAARPVDREQVRLFELEAEIEHRDARHRLALAADTHENDYGYRLESILFPVWAEPPPTGLEEITARLGSDRAAKARTRWRTAAHGRDTLQLVKTLVVVARAVREAYRQQHAIGQRSLGELIGVEQLFHQAEVQRIMRTADLRIAESWLLFALGQFDPAHIRRP